MAYDKAHKGRRNLSTENEETLINEYENFPNYLAQQLDLPAGL